MAKNTLIFLKSTQKDRSIIKSRLRSLTIKKGNYIYMNHKVEVTGINTSQLKTLSDEKADALMTRIKAGDKAARDEFITANLRLVLSEVGKFKKRADNSDDLFQVGCVGLIKAVDNFEQDKNVRFSTYAVPMIAGEIRRYLRESCALKVGRSTKDIAYKALSVRDELTKRTGREPELSDIAAAVGCDTARVAEALDAISDPLSLYEPVYGADGDEIYLSDRIADESGDAWLDRLALYDAMKHCSTREAKILQIRYYRGKTQTEAAEELGVSQAQISRIEKSALQKLKKYMT